MLHHTKKHQVLKVEKVSLSRTCHFYKKKRHIRPFCYRLFELPQQLRQKAHKSRRITVRKVWKPKSYNVELMAHISQKTLSKERWYFDSGCSLHMTGSKDMLNIEKSCGNSYVTFGNQTRDKILGSGRLISPDQQKLIVSYG
jgi:DNA-dependent RNA polymerase auxiliary subunit epsilon